MRINNLLAIVAHPDDLEIMAAGAISTWQKESINIHVIVLTDGAWRSPEGEVIRSLEEAKSEMETASSFMEYDTCEFFGQKNHHLEFCDELVCKVLSRIDRYNIDTILTCWERDSNRDHRKTAEIALAASRRVPNVLMGQINYYMTDFFTPNFYVDISEEWNRKIKAIASFKSQWIRTEKDWTEFLDITSKYYGKTIGVNRAEGFILKRSKY